MVALTIGMATYNDFDGVYFTLQALRLYHDLADTELLVVDNYGCQHTKAFVENWAQGRYVLATEAAGTAAPRDRVFAEAQGDAVLCCDSHILFAPGAIARLKAYYRDHPDSADLLHGPLVYDDLENISTHFEPAWRDQMWGIWATDPRGLDPEGEPFEIPMQGLGVFSCHTKAWLGFNPAFRGFGGEEGYIHEKVRQHGGRTLCLPWLRWVHRFARPRGVPYPLTVEDKLRNYLIGHAELGLDLAPVLEHFAQHLPAERVAAVAEEALRDQKPKKAKARKNAKKRRTVVITSDASNLPLVSCILPTYNRPPTHQYLIEEAIESFLRQTYPNKELILLNDCPGQDLVCHAPGVRVVNVSERFPSLGDKYNAGVHLSRGELIANWDDDDISLPCRLSLSVERLGDADYFNPQISWFMDGGKLHVNCSRGVGHNLSLLTRTAFEEVGEYPAISLGVDAEMDSALLDKVTCCGGPRTGQQELARSDWYYIYRWGVSPSHLSGSPDRDFWKEIGTRPIQEGRFVLHPHWRMDYEAETRRLMTFIASECSESNPDARAEPNQSKGSDGQSSYHPSRGVMLFVVGGVGAKRTTALRDFPLRNRNQGEANADYLARVKRLIADAVAAGGTHLLVPRETADWLDDNPLLVEYFAEHHQLVEASHETGIVFALRQ
jgi:glycosyltransferase involved in cell wall biosynthesis